MVSVGSSKSAQLIDAMEFMDLPENLLQQSHRDAFSVFGQLCSEMNMKNNYRNRLLLKRRQNIATGIGDDLEEIPASVTAQVFE